jgi:hypothetical protein
VEHITRSLPAMALAVTAACFYVLGAAFSIAAYATLAPSSYGTSSGFLTAGLWLQFVAGLAAMGAAGVACWEQVQRRNWQGAGAAAVLAVGALLVAIGWLVAATSSTTTSTPETLLAVGIGIWALLALGMAALRSLAEQQTASTAGPDWPRYADLWLAAAAALLILAIGSGFTLDVTDQGTGITAGALHAFGAAGVGAAIAVARTRGLLASRPSVVALTGLGLLAATGIAVAVMAGVAFEPDATLLGIRIGISVAIAVELAAAAALGIAAWIRVRELVAAGHDSQEPSLRRLDCHISRTGRESTACRSSLQSCSLQHPAATGRSVPARTVRKLLVMRVHRRARHCKSGHSE